MALTYGAFTQTTADALLAITGGGLPPCVGTRRFVNNVSGSSTFDGLSPQSAYSTVAQAIARAVAGDQIVIAPGDYTEALTITTSGLQLVGVGGPGDVAIATGVTNGSCLTIDGSSARVSKTSLYNIGLAADGTGSALYVKGNIRQVRVFGGKYESGDAGVGIKLESTAAGSVGDTQIIGAELAWNVTGINIDSSGGGDPVTETLIRDGWFHDCATDDIINATVAAKNVWVQRCSFWGLQDGSEATQYLDLDTASTTGVVQDCRFFTTVQAASLIALAATVLYIGDNRTQAEQPGTNAFGTNGRPD